MSRFLQLVLDMFDGATTKALQGLGADKRPNPKKRQPRQPKRLTPQSLMGGLHRDANALPPTPALHGPHMREVAAKLAWQAAVRNGADTPAGKSAAEALKQF